MDPAPAWSGLLCRAPGAGMTIHLLSWVRAARAWTFTRLEGRGQVRKPILLALMGASVMAVAAPAQPLAFEVASVKATGTPATEPMFCIVPCVSGERQTVVGSRVDIRYTSLQTLLLTAYRIKSNQLSGPDWMQSQRFDIAAKLPGGVSKDRVPEMLQALLAERFKLSVHRDRKEQTVYALVVGKSGSKLQESSGESD